MSGNINIGFVDQRSSSRVLKPPGGGYSDIFGTAEPPQVTPKKVNVSQSKVQDILATENYTAKPERKNDSSEPERNHNEASEKQTDEPDTNGTQVKGNQEEEPVESKITEEVEKLNIDDVSNCEADHKENGHQNGHHNGSNGTADNTANGISRKDSVQDIMNENVNVPQKKAQPQKSEENVPRQKTRVPPGGFSSGLW